MLNAAVMPAGGASIVAVPASAGSLLLTDNSSEACLPNYALLSIIVRTTELHSSSHAHPRRRIRRRRGRSSCNMLTSDAESAIFTEQLY
jgi:hypothetical protein